MNTSTPSPGLTHMQALSIIRKYEIDISIKHFPPIAQGASCQVLELGAGTGQQAKYLSDKGYSVFAIDLPSSSYKDTRIFKIKEYDGKNIPAENEQFDVVFSSNVLEHVVHIDDVLQETHRVLKKKASPFISFLRPVAAYGAFRPTIFGWQKELSIALPYAATPTPTHAPPELQHLRKNG